VSFYNSSARTTQKTQLLLLRRHVCSSVAHISGNVFTESLPSTGYTRHDAIVQRNYLDLRQFLIFSLVYFTNRTTDVRSFSFPSTSVLLKNECFACILYIFSGLPLYKLRLYRRRSLEVVHTFSSHVFPNRKYWQDALGSAFWTRHWSHGRILLLWHSLYNRIRSIQYT
jgi:hypothetical protein